MSRERARRRREREQEAAVQAAAKAASAERRERRAALGRRVTGRLPQRRSQPPGVLAQRRRRHLQATIGLLVLLNLVAWLVVHDPATSVLLVVVSLLVAPVVHTLLWRR